MLVTSQIAATDSSAASAISGRVGKQELNTVFLQQGLPSASLKSVSVQSTIGIGTAAASVDLSGVIAGSVVGVAALIALLAAGGCWYVHQQQRRREALWLIHPAELKYDTPVVILGRGTFGMVLRARYRGTLVAVKRVIPARSQQTLAGDYSLQAASLGTASLGAASLDATAHNGAAPFVTVASLQAGAGSSGTVGAVVRRSSAERLSIPDLPHADAGVRSLAGGSGRGRGWLRWQSTGSGTWQMLGLRTRGGADMRAMYRDFVEEMTLLSK